jgi:hypothetical protein
MDLDPINPKHKIVVYNVLVMEEDILDSVED